MTLLLCQLVMMLFVILAASELFTNALEHLGEKLKISDGVTGSLFAAIGTALPETIIPLLALFSGTKNVQTNNAISVGAILGAPLMLSTLSTCLMACSIAHHRGIIGIVRPEQSGFKRDLRFFIFSFIIAAATMYVPVTYHYIRVTISVSLVLIYCIYMILTLHASAQLVENGYGTEAEKKMFFARCGLPANITTIFFQLSVGLALLVFGAKGCIAGIEGVAHLSGISVFLLSLLIMPIATELPEKVNSILWARRGKDTLAFGNITGAMVFQGTILPAIGITLTPWQPQFEVLAAFLVAIIAVAWLFFNTRPRGISILALFFNGFLYAVYLYIIR